MSGPDPAELFVDLICIMSQLTKPDISFFFSAQRVLQVCGTLTKLYFYCSFISFADNRTGIPTIMRGSEVVAALRGIVNTTSLNTLSIEDKVAIRSLLDIINLCLFTSTYQVNA